MAQLVAIAGSSGFIGGSVRASLLERGCELVELTRADLRLCHSAGLSTDADALTAAVASIDSAVFDGLVERIAGVGALVNAAGAATPSAACSPEMLFANSILPLILQRACALSKRPARLVHISSAAVQGSRSILTEEADVSPESPYAVSKAAAEQALQASPWASSVRTILYRPTSVHGPSRDFTAQTKQLMRNRLMPVVGDGSAPLPVTSGICVAKAVAHIVQSISLDEGVVLHPWEQVTQADLLRACGGPHRRLTLSDSKANRLSSTMRLLPGARGTALRRRAEIFLHGQRIEAARLQADGFQPCSAEAVLAAFA